MFTLSGSTASSRVSSNAFASAYLPSITSSSSCSAQGFILNCHIVLPSVAAVVRSVGVVTRYKGAFSTEEGVRKRMVALATGPAVPGRLEEAEEDWSKGKGMVWVVTEDSDERI